jgi:transposase-like protein
MIVAMASAGMGRRVRAGRLRIDEPRLFTMIRTAGERAGHDHRPNRENARSDTDG